MIPMHCLSTPLQEASPFSLPWPTHQSPRAFWLAEATHYKHNFTASLEFSYPIYRHKKTQGQVCQLCLVLCQLVGMLTQLQCSKLSILVPFRAQYFINNQCLFLRTVTPFILLHGKWMKIYSVIFQNTVCIHNIQCYECVKTNHHIPHTSKYTLFL